MPDELINLEKNYTWSSKYSWYLEKRKVQLKLDGV